MLPHYEQNTMKKFLNVRNLRAKEKRHVVWNSIKKSHFTFNFNFNDKLLSNFHQIFDWAKLNPENEYDGYSPSGVFEKNFAMKIQMRYFLKISIEDGEKRGFDNW